MEATVRAICPQCQTALRIPAKWIGKAVKCKKCGAMVRANSKDEAPSQTKAESGPLIPAEVVSEPQPQANTFDFNQPPPPAIAPGPIPVGPPALDANGFPVPSAFPPAVGYPLPSGYPLPAAAPGTPAPGAAFPYAPPAGYPYPTTPPLPAGYNPPGLPAPGLLGGVPSPYGAPGTPSGSAAPGLPAYPLPPGYAPPGYGYPLPGAPAPIPVPLPAGAKPAPVATELPSEFEMEPAFASSKTRQRYRRRGSNKFLWIGFCLLLTGGLVAGGIFGSEYIKEKFNKKEDPPEGTNNNNGGGGETIPQPGTPGTGGPKTASSAFPRRLLFISITKYMYLNPLTASYKEVDLAAPAANRFAYDWRVSTEKDNNQLFILADTGIGPQTRLVMKNVLQGTYQEFFNTSRGQDRIVIYFGGHAIEKDGKAYIAPMEAEVDGDDWKQSLIPLDHFYGELQKCKAAQKVVVWDVCRFNPDIGRVRPGSEPMSEKLYKALTSPPAGIQAVTTCKTDENALEFTALLPDGLSGVRHSGSVFLDSLKFIAEPRNNRLPKITQKAEDALPVAQWMAAVEKRTAELAKLAEKDDTKNQTVTVAGAAPANLPAPNAEEKVAARFELPQAPTSASTAEIKALEREFSLPPIKSSIGSIVLADLPFPADVMKPYIDDGVTIEEIRKDKEKYALRNAVLNVFNKIRGTWAPEGSLKKKMRESEPGPITDAQKNEVKKDLDDWAIGIIELGDQLDELKKVANLRDSETKRWQAHYDFALASINARLAYMNEYNKLMGNFITDSLPDLDMKIGQNGYALVASEKMKSDNKVKDMAAESQKLFQEITVKYKGTPWAIQAKQEKTIALGLVWKSAVIDKK